MGSPSENDNRELEATISDVVAKSLAALEEQDLPAYEVLVQENSGRFL
jgi:hypothetical protein